MADAAFLDTMVLAYAVGGAHEQRDACRAILERAADGVLDLHVSAEAVQELLFHRLRRTDRETALVQSRHVLAMCVIHPLDRDVLHDMLDLVERTEIRGRDAIHAATALAAGFDRIVTTDAAFDSVPGLRRIAPADAIEFAG
ncbi:type II toxin-antitoxin system VapC family toxin [Luteipulveratus mongoliensis]|uniref:Ribonuclease VapC n=1 Tax=Luteipulveratus mongoliensis TaxID=571913 RepID=A0A0K1JEJ5_9MICO|nr:type II toxin-antitoxin system VapC family toxin [Luteipulveratus mongoliensis]AKU15124.1 hypothetical protein VV02_03345 [Luteipulveratus mongoliensis]